LNLKTHTLNLAPGESPHEPILNLTKNQKLSPATKSLFQLSPISGLRFASLAPARVALRAASGRVGSHSARNVEPFGLQLQPTEQLPSCLVPGQHPLARVQRLNTFSNSLVRHIKNLPLKINHWPLKIRNLSAFQRFGIFLGNG
jgi:hypothetical protein